MKVTENTKQKGFTLVEIIAVLVIVSIIASFAATKYFSVDESAKNVITNYEVVSDERNNFYENLLKKD
jgi:prepilin-type N-terminal cleavage/methylation domain-containing protein